MDQDGSQPGSSGTSAASGGAEDVLDRPLDASTHLPALDGLRGIAVLLVMIVHFCGPIETPGTLFAKILYKLTHWSWSGVDLFFVLSGFLITGILLDSKGSPRFFRTFYLRRALRIFPLYYGVLVVCFLVIPLVHPYRSAADRAVVAHQASLWIYCSNIAASVYGWVHDGQFLVMDHFWSLAVEEQFYMVWPLVVMASSRRTLFLVCAACVLIAPAIRTWFVLKLGDDTSAYVLMPCRMDALAWGALVALASRGAGGIRSLVPRARRGLLLSGLVIGGVIVRYRFFGSTEPIVQTLGYSAVAILWASVLILAVAAPSATPVGWLCRNRLLQATGRIAYGLYVFHYMINPTAVQGLVWLRQRMSPYWAALFYVIGVFAASFAISLASWHFYEKIFRRLKDRVSSRPMRIGAWSEGPSPMGS